MSYLTKKFNEVEMIQMLKELLNAGKTAETVLYCEYKETGFFASNRHIIPSYVAML